MLASRWHSPPKPGSVLSCVTGTCRLARRSASIEPCTSPSSTPTRTPRSSATTRSSSVVLPAPGALMKLTTLTPCAVEVRAVGASRSCCWRRAPPRRPSPLSRCMRPPRPRDSIDSTSNSLPLAISTSLPAARRTAERRDLDLPLVAARRCSAARASITSCSSRAPSHTRAARDELEVELERVRHHLAQPPDAQAHDRHPPPAGVLDDRVDDRAAQRQLVHGPLSSAGDAAPARSSGDRLDHELDGPIDGLADLLATGPNPSPRPRPARRRSPSPGRATRRPT